MFYMIEYLMTYYSRDNGFYVFRIVSLIVIALFIAIIWLGCLIVLRERSSMLRLVALGIVSTFGLQAIINLVVVTGLGPTKGIALPLVSSGGTGWLLTCFSLGILMAIERTQTAAVHSTLAPSIAPTSDLPHVIPAA